MSEPKKEVRKQVDWEAVEREYRIGIRSLRNIGEEFGCSEGAIRKRAKSHKWVKDLAEKVRQRAADLVRTQEVRNEVRSDSPTDKEKVEVSAQIQATALLGHRTDIKRHRALSISLLAEIEAQTDNPELFEQLGEMLANPDEKGVDKLSELYRKVISTPSRIDSMKKLSETLKNLIALERQALGLDEESKPGDDPIGAFLKQCSGRSLPIATDDGSD